MRAAHTDPGYQPRVSQDPTVRKNHGPIYNPGKVEAAMNAYYAEHPPLREWKPRTHEPTTAPKITPDQSKPAAKPSGDVPPGRPSVAKIKPASAPVSKPQEPKPESTAEQKLERDARRASEHAQHALERSNQATAAVKQFGEQHPFRKWAHDHNVVRSEEYTKLQSHARHAERRSVEAYNDSLSANLNVGKHKEELKQATPEKAPTYGKVDGRDSITLTKPGVGNDFQHGLSVDPIATQPAPGVKPQPKPQPEARKPEAVDTNRKLDDLISTKKPSPKEDPIAQKQTAEATLEPVAPQPAPHKKTVNELMAEAKVVKPVVEAPKPDDLVPHL